MTLPVSSSEVSETIRPPANDITVATVVAAGKWVKMRFTKAGLDANLTCAVVLRNSDLVGDPISQQTVPAGVATREVLINVPSEDTPYVVDLSCGSFGSQVAFTSGSQVSGTGTLTVQVGGVASVYPTVANMLLEYGDSPLLGQSATPVACTGACSASITATKGVPVYFRWVYRDVSNNVLATSDINSAILE